MRLGRLPRAALPRPAASLASVVVLCLVARTTHAAQCGDCWCVPYNDTGTCPEWRPANYTPAQVAAWARQRPTNPFALDCDPYADAACATSPAQALVGVAGAVCGLLARGGGGCAAYAMRSFASARAARARGAVVTHEGACGACSTTQDLAAYVAHPDLTSAGKACAAKALLSEAWARACYEALGFSEACAALWVYDGRKDSEACARACVGQLRAPNNGPPPACALNDCLQCDEDEAGPVFKAVAGRTRRRSGLESAIARPCSTVAQIVHEVCPSG